MNRKFQLKYHIRKTCKSCGEGEYGYTARSGGWLIRCDKCEQPSPIMVYGDGNQKYAGIYDFFGACAPQPETSESRPAEFSTFSLGVFMWESMAHASKAEIHDMTKKGKVFERFRGNASDADKIWKDAIDYCNQLNKGKTWQPLE